MIKRFSRFICACSITLALIGSTKAYVYAACPITSSTSDALSTSVSQRYSMLPSSVSTCFENCGWQIIIVDNASINSFAGIQLPEGYGLSGCTKFSAKTIALSNISDFSYTSINHEVGHFVDGVLSTRNGETAASLRSDFQTIYQAEKSSISDPYYTANATEYFAESFKAYVENPTAMQQSAPQTYTYINNIVSTYAY